MDIVDWILKRYPGRVEEVMDRIEISHDSGEHSTIWRNTAGHQKEHLSVLGSVYEKYDGMDLFSSTFKIASCFQPKLKNDVVLVQSLKPFGEDVKAANPEFPEGSIPFMYQAGIGFYAFELVTGTIFEWDTEMGELTGQYDSVIQVLDEWICAVAE